MKMQRNEETTLKIVELSLAELMNAIELVWDVFLEFEAVNYPEEGKKGILQSDS